MVEVNARIGSLLARVEEALTMTDEVFEGLLDEFDLLQHEASVRARLYNDGWMTYESNDSEVWKRDNVGSFI